MDKIEFELEQENPKSGARVEGTFHFNWKLGDDFIEGVAKQSCQKILIYLDEFVQPTNRTIGNENVQKKADKLSKKSSGLITYQLIKGERTRIEYRIPLNQSPDIQNFIRRLSESTKPPHRPNKFGKIPFLVLINPFSGQQRASKLWQLSAEPIFEDANIPFETMLTQSPGDATKIAQTLDLDHYIGVAIVSGDGLVAEFIEGLLKQKQLYRALKFPILHIPAGTGNGLAASVAFQSNEPFPARGNFCRQMAIMAIRPKYFSLRLYHVQIKSVDGQVENRPMFMSVAWGLIADIDIASERFRWAGMIRYHIEAFVRILNLPYVSRYRAKISYLPVKDEIIVRRTRLKSNQLFGELNDEYFASSNADDYMPENDEDKDSPSSPIELLLKNHQLIKAVEINDDVPAEWETIEGEFVYVLVSSLSHLGSDIPYMPCAKLNEEHFYLSFVDWSVLKSRFHMAQILLSITNSGHLDHPCLRTIPVMGCRVEPARGIGGFVSLDGEICRPESTFQVVPSSLSATIIGRRRRVDQE